MTERKSTEIKIRVTPSEKARWQADSEREGVSLSELICRNMNVTLNHLPNPAIAGTAPQFPSIWVNPVPRWDTGTHPAKVAVRRKEPCSHSRPPYAFCAECDR